MSCHHNWSQVEIVRVFPTQTVPFRHSDHGNCLLHCFGDEHVLKQDVQGQKSQPLDIQIAPEVWCFIGNFLGGQVIPSQQVFECLGPTEHFFTPFEAKKFPKATQEKRFNV